MLELKKVSKIYKTAGLTQRALDGVSIKFRKNEFVSILGQSGSGKTTLLNLIGGLDNYTSGDLIINGTSTKKYKSRDWDIYRNHRVGFVFQSYNLIPHQTALQNVELALTLSGVDKEERRKRSIAVLKKVGLEKQMHKRPNQMSGGQMQRIAIARALVNDPDILLADEPTGALDSETSIQVMELLKEIAHDKLVIMVTHNPDLAYEYSTRIVKLLDGNIIDDSDPFDGKEDNTVEENKTKKSKMGFLTALSLSLNNLMTKKGRTILTAFAGSIGIIGIALILSLSNGIQNYITKTEKETLGSYPLTISKGSIDFASILMAFMGNNKEENYDDDLIHSKNIMGDIFNSFTEEIKTNDLKTFKEYLENDGKSINDYVTDIKYGYNIKLNLYKGEEGNITRVNPTTVLDAIGMGTSSMSSAYSGFMGNNDVFTELITNDEYNKQQYDLVAGSWPKNYNEVVIILNKNNEISDYTLYTLGILDQEHLKEQFNNMTSGKEVNFEHHTYTKEDLLNLKYKLVLSSDYYKKTNGVWSNMSEDDNYMSKVLKDAPELKVVGILKYNEESVSPNSYGLVGYTHDLWEYIVTETNKSEIAKEQLANPEINVFTGRKFSDNARFDMNNLTKEQMKAIRGMSPEELNAYIETMSEFASATFEQNKMNLGISDLNDPDFISIYPKDFEAKEHITDIIAEYNKNKSEEDKIEYTDEVGMMMSSVTSIVNVISAVLIAFVAISLIVSSIMIAIITYISVIERTKEIGILRAIGASKKDISRVFNAETLIEGACAGIMGILVTILIDIPINVIIKATLNISGIASLPVTGAIILIIISIVLTLIAGLIPSSMASKKDPVEALRSE